MQGGARDGVPGQQKDTGSKPLKASGVELGLWVATSAPRAGRRGHSGQAGQWADRSSP